MLACSGSPDLFYVSNPGINADLMYFKSLGVDLIAPDHLDKGGYFESLSWENADKYQADLILLDNRTASPPAQGPGGQALLGEAARRQGRPGHPVASEPRFSYAGAAPLIESLAKAIEDAKKVS